MPRKPIDTKAADILADAGRALYGEHWRVRLTEAIGGNPDTIRRFMSGRMIVPDAVLAKIHAATRERITELEAVCRRIERVRQKERK